MKTKFLMSLLIVSLLCGLAQARESEPAGVPMPARVIGGISDGKPTPPAPPKTLPEYEIRQRQIVRKGGQKITINRVVPPAPPTVLPEKPPLREPVPQPNTLPYGGTFMVYATTYDDRLTYVRWNQNGQIQEAWSNANFKFLQGFTSFEGRGKRYTFMMLNGYSTLKQLREAKAGGERQDLPELADFTELERRQAPAYMLMKGDEKDEDSMEFMEAIHDLYEAEKPRLVAAHRERQRNMLIRAREEERLRLNPPPKPDVTVNYWKKTPEAKASNKPESTNK